MAPIFVGYGNGTFVYAAVPCRGPQFMTPDRRHELWVKSFALADNLKDGTNVE